ncbi:hypothetical protein [Streptomyces sp. NBC_00385]|uniref:hypothetical protein n=1 Tax=Streptomyces sp. NBC_00385 TaxID=2975733 RepID=UPI002DDAE08F|nr:hypothetical protein [Streptomyces sp. NBC_00385]
MDTVARYNLDAGHHVVLEGTLYADRNGQMLQQLPADHRGHAHTYCLDVSFPETVAGHATTAIAEKVDERRLLDRHLPFDLLPGDMKTLIGADSSPANTVDRIMQDTDLTRRRTGALTRRAAHGAAAWSGLR